MGNKSREKSRFLFFILSQKNGQSKEDITDISKKQHWQAKIKESGGE
jgi:hypothetical protein